MIHTCAGNSSASIRVGVSGVAGADNGIVFVMRTSCIGIATAIVHLTSVCERQRKQEKLSYPGAMFEGIFLPVQTVLVPVPVNTYPVLQVHLTVLSDDSCEQSALASHPPLFT